MSGPCDRGTQSGQNPESKVDGGAQPITFAWVRPGPQGRKHGDPGVLAL